MLLQNKFIKDPSQAVAAVADKAATLTATKTTNVAVEEPTCAAAAATEKQADEQPCSTSSAVPASMALKGTGQYKVNLLVGVFVCFC